MAGSNCITTRPFEGKCQQKPEPRYAFTSPLPCSISRARRATRCGDLLDFHGFYIAFSCREIELARHSSPFSA
ncbi:uncharacterized protein CLUP02_07856 [Colletotrichum lupini]|uniref:Uncharacterized protein n=1 Tax=Colletotrichum lupini TaxID=145971 RepID=A0A9Q8SSE5_9PEZI|nr:uncharacterized protein CLUP02_07856 [Colletotrichum lupini]UQC82368.1 hypothetical protein CLUP02_07856 [Colletotrichum lupini]